MRFRLIAEIDFLNIWQFADVVDGDDRAVVCQTGADWKREYRLKPRIGIFATFCEYGLTVIVGILAPMFLIGVICLPFRRETRDRG